MDDQISRQKLIEALQEVERRFPYKVAGKPDTYSEFNMAWESCMDCVFSAVESQPPADQWIPCSDPPKEDGMYFITAEVLDKLEVQYVFYQKNLNLFICNGRPIAWMPLPEPYKGE